MKKIWISLILASLYVLPSHGALEVGGVTVLGKTATRAKDTTDVVFVGDYKWIRVWATGFGDTCTVIAQTSRGGSPNPSVWSWSSKDSTVTARASVSLLATMYDSLYVRGGVRVPCPPAPYMRWIIASREAATDSSFTNIAGFSMYLTGGY